MRPSDAALGAAHRACADRAPLLLVPEGAVLLQCPVGMGAQLGKQRGFLRERDGGGGAATVGDRREATGRCPAVQIAPHGTLIDREAARDLGATAPALHRLDNPFT